MRRPFRGRDGITLDELLVALGVMALGMLAILNITPEILHRIALSEQHRKAVLMAENQMELLRVSDLIQTADQGLLPLWSEAGSFNDLPGYRGQFVVDRDFAGYKVKVSILWTSTGGEQSYELQTLISDRIQ